MIKSVSMQNFEAHEDTTVEFGDGMNSIVGLSNSGKSSILRAIKMVVDNDWDRDMVRTGSEFCRVRVETERGWVEAERGEKVNRWRCKEGDSEVQLFQKIGTTVPELATRILGMGRRDRGNGISELPNFQTQLEKHYMLAEVGDKKATSNMIAVMMDNAIGLGGMEDLIKDFSADLLKDRKWLNEKQQEIVELKSGIVDESIFSQYEKDVERIGGLKESVDAMDSDISVAEGYLARHDESQRRSDAAFRRRDAISGVDGMEALVEEVGTIRGGLGLAERALECERMLSGKNVIISIDADGMKALADRCEALGRTILNCEKVLEIEKRLERTNAVLGIDCASMERLATEAVDAGNGISLAEKRLSDARDVWRRQTTSEKEAKSLAMEQGFSEKEFEVLKDELGVCPLCGGRLE